MKKIVLHKEVIRNLSANDLSRIKGGFKVPPTNACSDLCSYSCPPQPGVI